MIVPAVNEPHEAVLTDETPVSHRAHASSTLHWLPRPGLGRMLWGVTSYVFTNVSVSLLWIYFKVLNRTKVIGKENIGEYRNTLLLSNHQSMIDSFPVAMFAFYPKSWLKPHLIPWHLAAEENFFRNKILRWMSKHWRCIPVRQGRRDLNALNRMMEVLPGGVLTLFPEGTRSRSADVGKGRPGAGFVIMGTQPRVIPVAIDGMQDVLPIGSSWPRLFKRIYVSYGPPVDYSDLLEGDRSRETAQAIVDRSMDAIRGQLAQIRTARNGGDPTTERGSAAGG